MGEFQARRNGDTSPSLDEFTSRFWRSVAAAYSWTRLYLSVRIVCRLGAGVDKIGERTVGCGQMSKKYAWTLIAITALPAIAWFVISSEPSTTGIEIAKLRPAPRSVSPSATKGTALVAARPVIVRSDGYLGSESCKTCHEDSHQSWHASYHRTMTQPVTPATAPAAIIDCSVEVQGRTYKFSRRNDDFFVELDDPIENERRMTRRLVLITGSHHAHLFWYESGFDKTPAQLQIMYIIDQQRWIPRRSFFLRPPNMEKENELGRWNEICSHCHSTHPRPRPDPNQTTWDTRVSDFGIACEACHGPGEAHVAFHRLDPDAPKQADDPIVNPMDLPTSARSDLCGQCHGMMMVSIDNAADQEQFYTHGRRFRPGDRLDEAHFLRVVRAERGTSGERDVSQIRCSPGSNGRSLLARRRDAGYRT